MTGLVELYVPEEPECIAWNKENQILICTPLFIHLLIPRREADNSIRFKRGSIQLQYLTLQVLDNDGANSNLKVGFKQACWWDRKPYSHLVLVTHSGKIYILVCKGIDRCHERSWQRADEFEKRFEKISVVCVASDPFGKLFVASEDGLIFGLNESPISAALQKGERISKMTIFQGNPLVCTSFGRVMYYNKNWTSVIDDKILIPGPVLVLPNNTILLAKFNRLYIIDATCAVNHEYIMPGLWQSITAIIPNALDSSVLVVGMDGSCFKLLNGIISRLSSRPWLDANQEIPGREDSGDEAEVIDEEVEAEESEGVLKKTIIDGVALAEDFSAFWVAETERRKYPLPSRTRLCFYESKSNVKADAASDQKRFITGEKLVLPDQPQWKGNCPLCHNASKSTTYPNTFSCSSGHVFNVCTMSGNAIDSISSSFTCHRCSSRFSRNAAIESDFVCILCSGALLQTLPCTNT